MQRVESASKAVSISKQCSLKLKVTALEKPNISPILQPLQLGRTNPKPIHLQHATSRTLVGINPSKSMGHISQQHASGSNVHEQKYFREKRLRVHKQHQSLPVPGAGRVQVNRPKKPALRALRHLYQLVLLGSCGGRLPRQQVHLEVHLRRPQFCATKTKTCKQMGSHARNLVAGIPGASEGCFSFAPGGHENHSRRRFFSHLVLEPRLPSACASSSDTRGNEACDFCWAFLRLEDARDIN